MSSRSLNKVMLIGNLTRDPELRYTPNGTAVCSFGLATNRSWASGDDGERKEETEFHRIVAWNKLAELCSQLLTKGRKVYIEGRLQTRSWETPEGDKRQATEVVAEDMVLLDSRRDAGVGGAEVHRDEVDKPAPKEESQEVVESKEEKKGKKKKDDEEETKEEKSDSDEIDIDDIPF
ncbi:MAG TPA: single-stranded DNA-binding protein [Candidatus Saccharimonadales bacterium]|nr:single-stranded DNA-binding protein [Candidatus Saccharimonadales bacterium]